MTNKEQLSKIYRNSTYRKEIVITETRNGNKYIMISPDLFVSKTGHMSYINDDLTAEYNIDFDIVNVYTIAANYLIDYIANGFEDSSFKNVLKINQTVELSMQEIADKFNIPVEKLKIKK